MILCNRIQDLISKGLLFHIKIIYFENFKGLGYGFKLLKILSSEVIIYEKL